MEMGNVFSSMAKNFSNVFSEMISDSFYEIMTRFLFFLIYFCLFFFSTHRTHTATAPENRPSPLPAFFMTSLTVTPEKMEPLLTKKSRKIRRQRKIISALLQDKLKKPKRRITKPPTAKQLAVRERMKVATTKAQQIYRAAPPGSMKWIDAVRQAWKQM